MSYNKYTKYQIMDAKYNKNLVNEELLVQKLPLKIVDPQPPKWFQEFEKRNNERWDKQDKVNTIIFDFMEKQNNINLMLIQRIDKLENKFENEQPKWFKCFADKQEQFNHRIETNLQWIKDVVEYNVKIGVLKTPK